MTKLSALVILLAVLSVLPQGCRVAQAGSHEALLSDLGFPRELVFEYLGQDFPFVLVGDAERSFLFFDIYDVAYYRSMLHGAASGLEILSIVYERDLAKEKIHKALRQGLKDNLQSDEWGGVSLEVEALLLSIENDVKAGDTLNILKVSEDKLTFIYNGQSIASFNNVLLVRALWAIWLGENSVVDRDSLSGHLP